MMEKVVLFRVFELSTEIPRLTLFYSGLKAITGIFNTNDFTSAKIEQALV